MTIASATKRCSRCKKDVSASDFHSNRHHADGLASQCKPCTSAISKAHYEANKPVYFARNQRTRKRQKLALTEQKRDTPCTDCGGKFHPFVMEFDHLMPESKLFNIADARGRSSKQVAKEIEKCELVCANCHKMRTFRRHQQRPGHVMVGIE